MKIKLKQYSSGDWAQAIGVWVLLSAVNYMVWCAIYDSAKLIWHLISS